MKILRRLYDWVLHWAETPYGGIALFLLAFAESSFFPIPPDPLLIALILGATAKAFKYAAACTIASVAGALLGYVIGHFLWWTPSGEFTGIANFFFANVPGFTVEAFYTVQEMYKENDFWTTCAAGSCATPYEVVGRASGAFDIDVPMFAIASSVGRGARFLLVAFVVWKVGRERESGMATYVNLLAIAC